MKQLDCGHINRFGAWLCTCKVVGNTPCDGSVLVVVAASSGLESEEVRDMSDLANHMGLLLQKTNIIRDYLVSSHTCCSWQS